KWSSGPLLTWCMIPFGPLSVSSYEALPIPNSRALFGTPGTCTILDAGPRDCKRTDLGVLAQFDADWQGCCRGPLLPGIWPEWSGCPHQTLGALVLACKMHSGQPLRQLAGVDVEVQRKRSYSRDKSSLQSQLANSLSHSTCDANMWA